MLKTKKKKGENQQQLCGGCGRCGVLTTIGFPWRDKTTRPELRRMDLFHFDTNDMPFAL
jgi:uncharacterized cysteine cluster protein YcgN (CxxCxxCC family)